MSEKKYTGYGYHGGGRKPKSAEEKHVTMNISGTREELDAIRQKAEREGKTTSRLIIETVLQD